ncbi:cation-translocating P-type ATPase C-terminal domain-containing protein, partial [Aurantimonas coralicida]|uniref:cation-translocating P-type ATPase C-terminal domain-containing protein n=1 Tax=Aurantimonas coralicida TaxID=182270 RepID=UPI00239A6745
VLMIRQTALSGAVIGIVGYLVFARAISAGWSEFEARNVLLFLMVAFENVHVMNCRSETISAFRVPLANNWPLLASIVAAQAIHIGAAFTPGLRDVLDLAPIPWEQWALLVPMALSVLVVMEIDKALRARRQQR